MKEEEEKPIQCPACESTAIGRLRIDCDWGDGGDWMQINKPEHYTAEELARFDRNERPDVECYICCRCGTCFE